MSLHDHHDADTTHTGTGGTGSGTGTGSGSAINTVGQFGFDDLANILAADQFFFAELDPLNNSRAEGVAFLALNGDKLTYITAMSGVEPGQAHAQHIHGFKDGSEGNVPDITVDFTSNGVGDADGFVETEEGSLAYGPILLDLRSPPGAEVGSSNPLAGFPKPDGDSYFFVETYDLSDPDSTPFGNLVLDTEAGADVPLTNRVLVVHGDTLGEGQGEGPYAADGTAGYKVLLPVASGEIEAFDREDVSNVLASFAFTHDSEFFNDANSGSDFNLFGQFAGANNLDLA